jgi:predicted transcriptional regulator
MEPKEHAKILFNQGISQKEIASILKISTKSINNWVKDGDWAKKRTEDMVKKQTAEEGVWDLINHQLRVLKRIKEVQELELDSCEDLKELKGKLIERGDIDALQKLFTTIKGKELEWTQRVKIVREFLEYVDSENRTLAKDVVILANQYLNEKRSDL